MLTHKTGDKASAARRSPSPPLRPPPERDPDEGNRSGERPQEEHREIRESAEEREREQRVRRVGEVHQPQMRREPLMQQRIVADKVVEHVEPALQRQPAAHPIVHEVAAEIEIVRLHEAGVGPKAVGDQHDASGQREQRA